jgi:hypothetical protein
VLFPFLARQLGGRATLASVRVNPNGGIDENAGYTVRLEGRTTDAANVSAIALDLERAGIFAEVVVEGSSRTADGGSAFTIRAPITTGSKDAAP